MAMEVATAAAALDVAMGVVFLAVGVAAAAAAAAMLRRRRR